MACGTVTRSASPQAIAGAAATVTSVPSSMEDELWRDPAHAVSGLLHVISANLGGDLVVWATAEADSGVLGVIRDLHGMHDTQGSLFSLSWALYTELVTAVLLFSIASGVLLILPRPRGRVLGLGAGALGLVGCVALAAAIW